MLSIIYTAEDEEPICTRCDNQDMDFESCAMYCGAEHGWYGYERTEVIKEDE